MSDVTGTGGDSQVVQAQIQEYEEQHPETDFSQMSVEDIMFLVMSDRAKAQKANIETYAATVEANTLMATNINNVKAAIDNGASSADGAKVKDLDVSWENADGSTEQIPLGEAFDRLGLSPTEAAPATKVEGDQQKVDSDLDTAQTEEEAWEAGGGSNDSYVGVTRVEVGKDVGDWHFYDWDAEKTTNEIQKKARLYNTAVVSKQDQQLSDDITQYLDDKDTLTSDEDVVISQADLKTLSADLADAHDKIDGDNQIAMAKLQKDMDDYQTTLQTIESSDSSMARTAQGFASKLGGG